MTTKTAMRIKTLKFMNEHIKNLGDEEIWSDWITLGVPDEPNYDDYEFIAETDEEYESVSKLFYVLCAQAEDEEGE